MVDDNICMEVFHDCNEPVIDNIKMERKRN